MIFFEKKNSQWIESEMYTLYMSTRCNNCVRFLQNLDQSEMKQFTHVVDVDKFQVPPGITCVPTLISSDGKSFTGKAAFDVLGQHATEIEAFDINQTNRLSWGTIENSRSSYASDFWGIDGG